MRDSIDLVIPAYNAANVIGPTLESIVNQRIPPGWQLRVYVFNDASTDDTAEVLARYEAGHDNIRAIHSPDNRGRSEARNRAFQAGSGSLVLFCDADCRYTRDDAILEFAREIQGGADAVIGTVEVDGTGFWASYTNGLTVERLGAESTQGLVAWGTTVNIAVRRSALEALGGYSTDYRRYGFEDKDFLVRLEQHTPHIVVRRDLSVSHGDDFTLRDVCGKFEEAGRYSAHVFRETHPGAYRRLAYYRCDATTSRFRGRLATFAGPLSATTRAVAAAGLALPLGFMVQRFLVRVACCAAYLRGTARAAAQKS